MPAAEVSTSVLEQLRKFDTPTICNVLELFDAMPRTSGYMDARIRACYPQLPPMVGFASTATFRAAAPPRAGDIYAGLAKQAEQLAAAAGPQIIVFQDLDDPPVAATFGEVMCTTYQAFGCVGLITSGAGRDLDQVEALKFPCFTAGTICSHGYTQIVELGSPVRVGGMWINPGDLLHGDRNGIAAIPIPLAAATAEACPEFMAAESVVLDYLKVGRVNPAGYATARNECQRRIGELAKRLKSLVK
ncbi:MAG TPA: RraA family protein [Urbifossiella sp.]|jgi:regulator of RNase E activity RraA|nr:RraA family protein [Urbifossiella sp.]